MPKALAIAILCIGLLPASAAASEWEVGLQAGLGAFIGEGWDANDLGGAYALSVGPRLNRYVALHGMFVAQHLRLRTVENDGEKGGSFGLMFAPQLYPLGDRYKIEPYFSPLAGYAYTSARIDKGAQVDLSTRALLLGATLGGLWALSDVYGVGVSAMLVRFFIRKSCIKIEGGRVSCGALGDTDTRLATLFVTFRATFGRARTGSQ